MSDVDRRTARAENKRNIDAEMIEAVGRLTLNLRIRRINAFVHESELKPITAAEDIQRVRERLRERVPSLTGAV